MIFVGISVSQTKNVSDVFWLCYLFDVFSLFQIGAGNYRMIHKPVQFRLHIPIPLPLKRTRQGILRPTVVLRYYWLPSASCSLSSSSLS